MFLAEVQVGFKEGVADPEGANTQKALHLLGFDEVEAVRSAKTFQLEVDADDADGARQRVEEMCTQLLANPVVNTYDIEVTER
ncbi:phosphoribosylformylglycinamidine synthase [Thermoplasmatales archaeon SW_10_69_26]|jgi:phosphoribosylformylglycinamidine synthase|nr:MAG: phosphoribosylformylglycinamidine synthase [Thermoplasmatales archaeon SW_10_69_26]